MLWFCFLLWGSVCACVCFSLQPRNHNFGLTGDWILGLIGQRSKPSEVKKKQKTNWRIFGLFSRMNWHREVQLVAFCTGPWGPSKSDPARPAVHRSPTRRRQNLLLFFFFFCTKWPAKHTLLVTFLKPQFGRTTSQKKDEPERSKVKFTTDMRLYLGNLYTECPQIFNLFYEPCCFVYAMAVDGVLMEFSCSDRCLSFLVVIVSFC